MFFLEIKASGNYGLNAGSRIWDSYTRVPCSKPLGSCLFDLTFHLSMFDKMIIRTAGYFMVLKVINLSIKEVNKFYASVKPIFRGIFTSLESLFPLFIIYRYTVWAVPSREWQLKSYLKKIKFILRVYVCSSMRNCLHTAFISMEVVSITKKELIYVLCLIGKMSLQLRTCFVSARKNIWQFS